MLVQVACGLERVAGQVGVDETTVVRLGGDEFAITLHSASPLDLDLVRRHLDRLRREQVDLGDSKLEMGFSCGVAMATGSPDLASLLSGADLTAYEEKRARRTHVLTNDDVSVRPR